MPPDTPPAFPGAHDAPGDPERALTLGSFLAALAARLNRLNEAAVEPISIRAIPVPPPAHRKVYAGLEDTSRSPMTATFAEWCGRSPLTGRRYA
jgi:hypothetical protein